MFPPPLFFSFSFEGSGDHGNINVVFPNCLDHLTFDMSLFCDSSYMVNITFCLNGINKFIL